jgi:hypothetical protein
VIEQVGDVGYASLFQAGAAFATETFDLADVDGGETSE